MSSGLGHTNGTLASRDTMKVTLRTDTHGGGHRLAGADAHFDSPLHLLDVLKVLHQPYHQEEEEHTDEYIVRARRIRVFASKF